MQSTAKRATRRRTLMSTAVAAALGLTGLAGCGDTQSTGTAVGASPAVATSAQTAATSLTVKDPWVKAADTGMTAAFAILVNDTDTDVTVRAVTSPASPMELHEMAMKAGKMVMQPKTGGIVVKARSTHELKPGGDHLMLMKPSAPIRAGDEVSFTLALADGTSLPFTAIAKPFAGAGESYDPASGMPMAGTSSPTS